LQKATESSPGKENHVLGIVQTAYDKNHYLCGPKQRVLMVLPNRNAPRWIVFIIDLSICFFSLVTAYLLRFNFAIPEEEINNLVLVIPYVLTIRTVFSLLFRTYANIIRYTSSRDAQRIFIAIGVGSLLFCFINYFAYMNSRKYIIPFSIIIIDYITTVFVMTFSRLLVKVLYLELRNPSRTKTNVIIYGAGESGIITKRALDRDAGTKYKVIAFVDDDPKKVGKKLEGITIHNSKEDMEELLKENNIAHLIISIQNIAPHIKKQIIESCLLYNTKVLNVPPVHNWINGELSFKQIKKIKIEDLLEREPIRLDIGLIKQELTGKRVLVTGAAGSIGSEIARQLVPFTPGRLILLDQAESPLYDIELELMEKHRLKGLETVIGDVRNPERMRNVFRTFNPEIVFHAAAYKHVPVMENNPSEGILTNVFGTKVVADLSVEFGVKKFVMISTDKAVNPTNIMGATKRVAEIYTQSLNTLSSTKFITTRFGNVLGSNGSVIPRFRKQLEEGGPITVTHPEITRYFMTISEACQLVLEAGALGKGGEIFIFDMGKSVKIADLAKKMIKLSGLTLGKDIQLIYTGLRPGEKLYEELLNDHENTLSTHHPKIMIARVKEYDFEEISREVNELISLFQTQNNEVIVRKMKDIVPEFISNNSVYEQLDKVGDMIS
jgi:FlaA1/EpsC-like NDP-sugar epimerase